MFLTTLFLVEFKLVQPISGAPSVAAVIDFIRDLLFMLTNFIFFIVI